MAKIHVCQNGFIIFRCPGCGESHGINTDPAHPNELTNAKWSWNGSVDAPTFAPSILVRGTHQITDDEHKIIMAGGKVTPRDYVCHSFVREGRIEFCSDSTHEHAGKILDLPEFDQEGVVE